MRSARRIRALGWFILAALICAGSRAGAEETAASKGEDMSIKVESSVFQAGSAIPKQYTGEGPDVSPPLSWSGVPAEAKALALICDDPDAPRKEPWVHWVIYSLPRDTHSFPENVAGQKTLMEPKGALQGVNDFGKPGYNGPLPPPGHGVHHYHFKLYALDASLSLAPGATKAQLLAAMKGHILAEGELIGTYERKR